MTDGKAAATSGIAHAAELVALAEAMVGDDDAALAGARGAVQGALGAEALVDAVAVASNFERMVRIADGTGIPLDAPVNAMTEDLRGELGIDAYAARASTPELGPVGRAVGRLAGRALPGIAKLVGPRAKRFLPKPPGG